VGQSTKGIGHYCPLAEKEGPQSIRKANWQAVKYNALKQPDRPIELYNLSKDLGKSNDIAGKHPEIVKEMQEIFNKARTHSEIFTFGQAPYL